MQHPSRPHRLAGWAHVMKVLIVEDDPSERLLLQTLVAEEGHTVEVAVDGAAGLDAFRQLRPDRRPASG